MRRWFRAPVLVWAFTTHAAGAWLSERRAPSSEESLSPEGRGREARSPRSRASSPTLPKREGESRGHGEGRDGPSDSAPPKGGPRTIGARRLLRGSHPREGRRTFPRGKRGARRTEVVSPCGGIERGNPFALRASARKRSLGNQDQMPASGKRSHGPFVRAGEGRMLERACPCVASGLQKSTSSIGPAWRVRPRSGRADDGLAFHPLPISRAPKGTGDKDGGSGPGLRGRSEGEADAGIGAGDASPEPVTSHVASPSREERCARPAASRPRVREMVVVDGRRFGSWKPVRGHARVGGGGLGPLGASISVPARATRDGRTGYAGG